MTPPKFLHIFPLDGQKMCPAEIRDAETQGTWGEHPRWLSPSRLRDMHNCFGWSIGSCSHHGYASVTPQLPGLLLSFLVVAKIRGENWGNCVKIGVLSTRDSHTGSGGNTDDWLSARWGVCVVQIPFVIFHKSEHFSHQLLNDVVLLSSGLVWRGGIRGLCNVKFLSSLPTECNQLKLPRRVQDLFWWLDGLRASYV